ncbi:MAG: hypothetical protein AAGC77_08165, partial [Pseudomonadota bacterium]
NLIRCRALGDAIIEGLPGYIGCAQENIIAIPPQGPFDPQKDYGDDAFSFSARPVVALEPVSFGVALTMKNFEDSGALWLRTTVTTEISGDAFEVFVAQRPRLKVPLRYEGQLEPVWEAVFQEFLDTFKLDVMEFNDERFSSGIGFLP